MLDNALNTGREHRILFVCLGNICRSPAAEAIMRRKLDARGLGSLVRVDSAGLIDCHEGELPDVRMRAHAGRRGYSLAHRSRPVCLQDFLEFDVIAGMDDANVAALAARAAQVGAQHKICRITDFCRVHDATSVPDPYYGGADGFDYALDLLEDACDGLCDKLEAMSASL